MRHFVFILLSQQCFKHFLQTSHQLFLKYKNTSPPLRIFAILVHSINSYPHPLFSVLYVIIICTHIRHLAKYACSTYRPLKKCQAARMWHTQDASLATTIIATKYTMQKPTTPKPIYSQSQHIAFDLKHIPLYATNSYAKVLHWQCIPITMK